MTGRPADIAGIRFGRLVAISDVGSDGKQRLWKLRCDCGATVVRPYKGLGLRAGGGGARSCGCLNAESLRSRNDAARVVRVGVRFGRLTVRHVDGKHAVCDCDCGRLSIRRRLNLLSRGDTASCGCLRSQAVAAKNRSKARRLVVFGVELTVDDIAALAGATKAAIYQRLRLGKSPEDALTAPYQPRQRPRRQAPQRSSDRAKAHGSVSRDG